MADALTGERPGRTLKIYLLLIDHARFFFYSDESEASDDSDDADDPSKPPAAGVHGWFRARYKRFKSAWQHADSGALLWMRRSWNWLQSWAHPDEAMLARLWSARGIDLHHPAARRADEIRAIWADYLKRQGRRHLVWLIVNGTIAPFSVLFAPLPGPNLIGYWFAYRAIHHSLVVWGIRRVQRNKVPIEFHPIAALDLPVERDGDGKLGHVALKGAATGLAEHVTWHSASRTARVESKPPVDRTLSDSRPANFQAERSQDG
jgi:Mitochondrial K+-H+ exchange-related